MVCFEDLWGKVDRKLLEKEAWPAIMNSFAPSDSEVSIGFLHFSPPEKPNTTCGAQALKQMETPEHETGTSHHWLHQLCNLGEIPVARPALLMALSENAENPNVQFIISMKIATLGWSWWYPSMFRPNGPNARATNGTWSISFWWPCRAVNPPSALSTRTSGSQSHT